MGETLDQFIQQLNYRGRRMGIDAAIPEGLSAQGVLEALCAAYAPWFDKEKKYSCIPAGQQPHANDAFDFLTKIELVDAIMKDGSKVYCTTPWGIDIIIRVMSLQQLFEYANKYQTPQAHQPKDGV